MGDGAISAQMTSTAKRLEYTIKVLTQILLELGPLVSMESILSEKPDLVGAIWGFGFYSKKASPDSTKMR